MENAGQAQLLQSTGTGCFRHAPAAATCATACRAFHSRRSDDIKLWLAPAERGQRQQECMVPASSQGSRSAAADRCRTIFQGSYLWATMLYMLWQPQSHLIMCVHLLLVCSCEGLLEVWICWLESMRSCKQQTLLKVNPTQRA